MLSLIHIWEYASGGDYGKELLDGLEGDKNLLYAVARRGSVLYTNTSDGGFLSSGQPPEGYRFALRCDCLLYTSRCV